MTRVFDDLRAARADLVAHDVEGCNPWSTHMGGERGSYRYEESLPTPHGKLRIIHRQVILNVLTPGIAQVSLGLWRAILSESALSFVGLGTQPPTPSWGNMLSEGRQFLGLAPWNAVFPGLAIMLVVLGFNLLGDGLRDLLDPRLR